MNYKKQNKSAKEKKNDNHSWIPGTKGARHQGTEDPGEAIPSHRDRCRALVSYN
jgi:hypothetical protein